MRKITTVRLQGEELRIDYEDDFDQWSEYFLIGYDWTDHEIDLFISSKE